MLKDVSDVSSVVVAVVVVQWSIGPLIGGPLLDTYVASLSVQKGSSDGASLSVSLRVGD